MNSESKVYRLLEFGANYVIGAVSSVYLFTLGMLSPRNRSFVRTIAAHFGRQYKPVRPVIPEAEVSQAADGTVPVYLMETQAQDGNVSLLEMAVINQMIRARNPRVVFELGTFDGRTTLNMAWNTDETAKIYTLDLPKEKLLDTGLPIAAGDKVYIDKEASGIRYAGTPVEKKIVQLYGDTATFDFSPYFGSVDVVFIDAAHSYEYVLSDTANAMKLLKGGRGLLLWHDYDAYDGVTAALNELYQQDARFRGLRRIKGTNLVFLSVG